MTKVSNDQNQEIVNALYAKSEQITTSGKKKGIDISVNATSVQTLSMTESSALMSIGADIPQLMLPGSNSDGNTSDDHSSSVMDAIDATTIEKMDISALGSLFIQVSQHARATQRQESTIQALSIENTMKMAADKKRAAAASTSGGAILGAVVTGFSSMISLSAAVVSMAGAAVQVVGATGSTFAKVEGAASETVTATMDSLTKMTEEGLDANKLAKVKPEQLNLKGLSKDQQVKVTELGEAHAKQVNGLNADQKSQLSEMDKTHVNALKKLDTGQKGEVLKLEETHSKNMNSLKEEHQANMKIFDESERVKNASEPSVKENIAKERGALEKEYQTRTNTLNKQQTEKVDGLKDTNQKRFTELQEKLKNEKQNLKADLDGKRGELKNKLAGERKELTESLATEVKKMKFHDADVRMKKLAGIAGVIQAGSQMLGAFSQGVQGALGQSVPKNLDAMAQNKLADADEISANAEHQRSNKQQTDAMVQTFTDTANSVKNIMKEIYANKQKQMDAASSRI